jgi:hypothetical protein
VLFMQPWRLFLELRKFQDLSLWLVGSVFAPGRLLSVKLQTALALGRWMQWEKRPTLPRAYRPLPLSIRYSFQNRQDVSYRQLSIYKTLGSRNSKV